MDNPSLGWEKAVLGTGLAYPDSMEEAGELLPSDFSIEAHQVLWAEMLSLTRRQALDHRAVVESLRSTGQLIVVSDAENIGEDYIAELMTHRGASMHEYSERVLDIAIKRELRKVAALIRAEAEDENIDAQEAMDSAEKRLLGLRRNKSGNGSTMADLIGVFNSRLAGLLDGTLSPAWVPHLEALRDVVDYIDAEDYIVLAARPGDGKSSLLRYEFLNAAMRGTPVLMFNLENGPLEYAKFAISMVTGIDSDKLKSPRRLTEEDKEAYRTAAEVLASKPMYVETLASPSAVEVERICRSYISQKHVKLIGLDYVQLVKNGLEKRVEDVTETSSVLRSIPIRYGVPLVTACQLSREIVHRGENAEPQLSDLRESGSLEQDATMVWFPRPVWANPTDAQLRTYSQNLIPNTSQLYPTIKALPYKIHVKKNRNGGTGTTRSFLWMRSTNQFFSLTNRGEN
jgi:replicative DNA helicase